MARPIDAQRRQELLDGTVDYIIGHGVAGLSLRPLADALGTSDRMLIHHFGSKQELLTQALAASTPRVPPFDTSARLDDTILGIWHAMAEGSQRARVMLTLEVMALAVHDETLRPLALATTTEWLDRVTEALERHPAYSGDPREGATLLVSGLKGFALDLYVTGDTARVESAVRRLARALVDL